MDERTRQADQFVRATLRLRNGIHNNEETWSEEFDEQAINGWFAEELPTRYAGLLPEGISDPRLRIEQDGAWIAFRARRGMWSGVVNCRLKAWVAAPNELAIEIQSLRAGLIPIPVDDVVADWKRTPGTIGIRMLLIRAGLSADAADPGLNRVLATAARLSVPVILPDGDLFGELVGFGSIPLTVSQHEALRSEADVLAALLGALAASTRSLAMLQQAAGANSDDSAEIGRAHV